MLTETARGSNGAHQSPYLSGGRSVCERGGGDVCVECKYREYARGRICVCGSEQEKGDVWVM